MNGNMKTNRVMATVLAILLALVSQNVCAQSDPLGGKPVPGSKPSAADLEYQVKYQRAFEAVLWSMPAIAIYSFHRAAADLGAGPNVIFAWSQPAKPNLEALTGNNQTPYITSQTDLRKGPVVLEVPAASDKASIYGQIVDHWQITIADVGPSGVDAGKGGRLLLVPPGYDKKIPSGYIKVGSPSYRVTFAFRSVPGPEATAEEAYEYARTLKMYYLSELPNPEPTRFIDPIDKRYSTLPLYDERWFEEVYEIVTVENVLPRDKIMMGMLTTLGIQKGKPYNPDETTRKAMRQAVVDAYYYMQQMTLKEDSFAERWWEDKNWYDVLYCDENNEFVYDYSDRLDLDSRAIRYFSGTFFPRKLGPKPAVQYVFALADNTGKELQAGKTYSLTMPPDVPVAQFWSLIIYDLETWAFIYNPLDRAGLSSYDLANMKKNSDGSVTLYFGPKAPDGQESNWIPTEGKRPLPVVRFYGGTDALFDRSWQMPDVELVD